MSEIEPQGKSAVPTWRRLVADERVAFVAVGGVNTVVGLLLFAGVDRTLGEAVDKVAGRTLGSLATLAISHVAAVLVAFVLHRRIVFKVRGNVWSDLARFESVYLVGLAINAVALPLAVNAGAPRLLSQAVILACVAIGTYLGHKHFSFKRPSATRTAPAPAAAPDGNAPQK